MRKHYLGEAKPPFWHFGLSTEDPMVLLAYMTPQEHQEHCQFREVTRQMKSAVAQLKGAWRPRPELLALYLHSGAAESVQSHPLRPRTRGQDHQTEDDGVPMQSSAPLQFASEAPSGLSEYAQDEPDGQ